MISQETITTAKLNSHYTSYSQQCYTYEWVGADRSACCINLKGKVERHSGYLYAESDQVALTGVENYLINGPPKVRQEADPNSK